MSFLPAPLPELLKAQSYPIHFDWQARWSDMEDGQLSRIGAAQMFEDHRANLLRTMFSVERFDRGDFKGLLVNVALHLLAPGRFGLPVTLAGGIASIGRSSYRFALAGFQQGQCIALCGATGVNFGKSERPSPLPDEQRLRLESFLLQGASASTVAPRSLAPEVDWEHARHHQEWPTRFSDTDAVGHVNNVATLRYHDNALMGLHQAWLAQPAARPEDGRWRVEHIDMTLEAENFYPKRMQASTVLAAWHEEGFELVNGLFQAGQRTGTARIFVTLRDAEGRLLRPPEALRQWLGSDMTVIETTPA